MGLLSLVKVMVRSTVQLPVAVISDTFTLGGAATETESAVMSTLSEIKEDIDEIAE